ncbi:MAG: hypothetical protein ACRC8W_02565 [Plesiomonas shigelloides]
MGVMLYRAGTQEVVWGFPVDLTVVEPDDIEEHLSNGWFRSPEETLLPDNPDANGDGELSLDEAKKHLDSIGVDYAGLHWTKVVSLAKENMGE